MPKPTIKSLLLLLRNEYCHSIGPDGTSKYPGLCSVMYKLDIDMEFKRALYTYIIRDNKPDNINKSDYYCITGHFFRPYLAAPRVKYLDRLIKEINNETK